MVMYSYRGIVQNGQIQLVDTSDLLDGTEVIVTVVKEGESDTSQGFLLEELRSQIGIWADRDDIGDTIEFSDELRRRSQTRDHDERS